MSIPKEFSFTRYLAAKKSVDDRSLNYQVFAALKRSLETFAGPAPLRVLEIGCGLGTMVERLLDWDLLRRPTVYTGIDLKPENIVGARKRLSSYAARNGYPLTAEAGVLQLLPAPEEKVSVALEAMDLHDFLRREQGRRTWDLLIAHAFLDLVDLPTTLPPLLSLLERGGFCYFTLNFDGATIFLPSLDPEFDRQIEELYHQTMDQRLINGRPSGHSRTGRLLFRELPAAGAQILAAGASDWVVHPGPEGYPADESYFLHFIIHTVDTALTGHPQLPQDRFRDWVAARHRQIERGELVYLARQLDFLGYLERK
ncbi:MAG: class I SAM-dependent methyltransferase [Syntrophales bacterium]|nr:class I SAM-dependent methyltransferase [Syntrophales bacterium]